MGERARIARSGVRDGPHLMVEGGSDKTPFRVESPQLVQASGVERGVRRTSGADGSCTKQLNLPYLFSQPFREGLLLLLLSPYLQKVQHVK